MFKHLALFGMLIALSGCLGLATLPQTSLATDVSAADTKFSSVVAQLTSEYQQGHICKSKMKELQNIVRQANAYIENAYDAATIKNVPAVSKYLTRLETLRRDLEFELNIIKTDGVSDGCPDDSSRTTEFAPALA